MKTQCYREKTKVNISDDDSDREKMCKELGLSIQAKIGYCDAKDFYLAMTEKEIFIWQRFLPSSYSHQKGEWKEYNFDVVPNESLEEISFATSLRAFTDLEIWTPRGRRSDPLVVGLVGSRHNRNTSYHMITRWGESLAPFPEIEKLIMQLFQKNGTKGEVPEIAQTYMEKYVIETDDKNDFARTIFFKGKALLKSCCCKETVYRFKDTGRDRHFLCSKCGEKKIKPPWSIFR